MFSNFLLLYCLRPPRQGAPTVEATSRKLVAPGSRFPARLQRKRWRMRFRWIDGAWERSSPWGFRFNWVYEAVDAADWLRTSISTCCDLSGTPPSFSFSIFHLILLLYLYSSSIHLTYRVGFLQTLAFVLPISLHSKDPSISLCLFKTSSPPKKIKN